MPITTLQELHDATRNALDGAGLDAGVVSDALFYADMQIIPTVCDDRYWRLVIDAVDELRVLDSEDLPRELTLVLAANPGAAVVMRPADEEETNAYLLLGAGGLRELDERRRQEETAIAEETAAALTAALGEAQTDPRAWIPDWSSADDWQYAIEAAAYDTATADVPPVATAPITMADVAAVDAYALFYHDERWKPGDPAGSELQLYAILRLKDGRWASLESWNDYTGWGCQDGSTVRIGPDRESVIRFGLTKPGRQALADQLREAS